MTSVLFSNLVMLHLKLLFHMVIISFGFCAMIDTILNILNEINIKAIDFCPKQISSKIDWFKVEICCFVINLTINPTTTILEILIELFFHMAITSIGMYAMIAPLFRHICMLFISSDT